MKRLYGFLGTALLSAGALMLITDDALAQRGGRGGRGGGSGVGWGPGGYGWHGSGSGWSYGWTPGSGFYAGPSYYGRGYYDGYGRGGYYDGYGRGGYYDGYGRGYGGYYGRGYYDGYYGGYYPSYRSYYSPSYGYYDYGYSYPSYGFSSGVMPAYGQAPAAQDNSVAHIEVKLPDANGEVWFDGQKTRQSGTTRTFTTPPLEPGNYTYRISAAWHRDGGLVTQDRTVTVRAGATVSVDFTQAQAAEQRQGERVQDR